MPASSDGPVGCRVLRSGEGKKPEARSVTGLPRVPRGSQLLSKDIDFSEATKAWTEVRQHGRMGAAGK